MTYKIKEMPEIGFGTGGGWIPLEETKKIVDIVLKQGFVHIDTAEIYNNEWQVGEVLKKYDRQNIFLATKVFPSNIGNFTKDAALESMRRLKVEYIDLFYLHSPVSRKRNAKAYRQLMELRNEGKIRFIGVSNYSKQQLIELKEDVGEYPYVNQIYLSPVTHLVETEKYCLENNIKLVAYSVTRSYYNHNLPWDPKPMTNVQRKVIDEIATKYNKSVAQVLNSWALSIGYNLIPKSTKPERNLENLNTTRFLEKEDIDTLNSMKQAEAEFFALDSSGNDPYPNGLRFEKNYEMNR